MSRNQVVSNKTCFDTQISTESECKEVQSPVVVLVAYGSGISSGGGMLPSLWETATSDVSTGSLCALSAVTGYT